MADRSTRADNGSTRDQILALIDRMPEKMQLKLLRFLEAKLPKHITGDLVADKRTEFRRMCLIGVDYQIDGKPNYGFILDISAFGVFIESDEQLPVDKRVQLRFSLPGHPTQLNLSGDVVWSGSQGFGVKFNSLARDQMKMIRSFSEQQASVYTIVS